MHQGERVLLSWAVVQRDIQLAVKLFEGIENEEAGVRCFLFKTSSYRVGMKVPRLEVNRARRGLELRLVNRRRELTPAEIEVAIPHLRLPFARVLAREVAAQRMRVFLDDPGHPARAGRECRVRERLLSLREVDDTFRLQRLQAHDGQRGVDEGPAAVFPSLEIVRLGDDVSPVTDTDELRIMRPLHLRCGDFDEAPQHDVASQSRIPVTRQELVGVRSVQRGQRRQQQGGEESRAERDSLPEGSQE
jgi:hypothetical protein